eukprot:PhM_4_TR5223/c5_g1_i2/m.54822
MGCCASKGVDNVMPGPVTTTKPIKAARGKKKGTKSKGINNGKETDSQGSFDSVQPTDGGGSSKKKSKGSKKGKGKKNKSAPTSPKESSEAARTPTESLRPAPIDKATADSNSGNNSCDDTENASASVLVGTHHNNSNNNNNLNVPTGSILGGSGSAPTSPNAQAANPMSLMMADIANNSTNLSSASNTAGSSNNKADMFRKGKNGGDDDSMGGGASSSQRGHPLRGNSNNKGGGGAGANPGKGQQDKDRGVQSNMFTDISSFLVDDTSSERSGRSRRSEHTQRNVARLRPGVDYDLMNEAKLNGMREWLDVVTVFMARVPPQDPQIIGTMKKGTVPAATMTPPSQSGTVGQSEQSSTASSAREGGK